MTDVKGCHAIVTGGSSGIGLAVASLLAANGAKVSLIARDDTKLGAGVAQIHDVTPSAAVATAPADVTDRSALGDAVTEVTEAQGPCDVLVACAGSAHPGYFEQLDDAVFRQQMEVDYFGTLHAVRAVVPAMMARGRGHLVLVSSAAGLIGVFGYSAYAPAKFAVRGLAETLRPELAPHGIVTACAYPPDTRTPGFDRENELKPPETVKISAAIKPRDAAPVAKAIVRGIERDQLVITADVQTAVLARAAGLLNPYVRRTMDRTIRRMRGTVDFQADVRAPVEPQEDE